MSTIFVESGGAASGAFSLSYLVTQARLPLHAWSGRRRWLVVLLIVALVFGLGAHGWVVADFSGVEASRAALTASTQRLADASRSLAQLPALRRASAAMPAVPSLASWSSADDVRIVSELATQSCVTLLAVEPGAASGVGAERGRPLQLTAHTDFVHLMAFLRGLSDLPVLIVPVDVTVKQDAASLSVSATLRVFSALRPAPLSTSAGAFDDASLDSDDDEDIVFFDPFSRPQMQSGGDVPDGSSLRLVGLLRDLTRGLALLDTPDGSTTVTSGQQVGAERVTKIDALGVTLANGGATRMLVLTEAS
jgi:Tfp pilus assembly protein PilO